MIFEFIPLVVLEVCCYFLSAQTFTWLTIDWVKNSLDIERGTRVISTDHVLSFIFHHPQREREGNRVRISYSDLTMQKVDEDTSYSDRISVQPNSDGETLIIQDVKLSDEREFFCQVSGLAAGNGEGRTLLKVFGKSFPHVSRISSLNGLIWLLLIYIFI